MKLLLTFVMLTALIPRGRASIARMVGLGQMEDTGSYYLDDYRNIFRNPVEDIMQSMAVAEVSAGEAGVFYDSDMAVSQLGIFAGREGMVDMFAGDGAVYGFRGSIGRAETGKYKYGFGGGLTIYDLSVYANYDKISMNDHIVNVGGKYAFDWFTLFGEMPDVEESDFVVGVGKLIELSPAVYLNTDIIYMSEGDDDLFATVGATYMFPEYVKVFGSIKKDLKTLDDAEVNLGASFKYKQFEVEGLVGTTALLDLEEAFTLYSVAFYF